MALGRIEIASLQAGDLGKRLNAVFRTEGGSAAPEAPKPPTATTVEGNGAQGGGRAGRQPGLGGGATQVNINAVPVAPKQVKRKATDGRGTPATAGRAQQQQQPNAAPVLRSAQDMEVH